MGWFKKLFDNKNDSLEKEGIITELVIRDETYILEQVDIEFKRDRSGNKDAINEAYGGFVSCTLKGKVGKHLLAWAIYSDWREDGDIRFYTANHSLEQGAAFILKFMDANCISFCRTVDNCEKERKTELLIAPHILMIGREELVNEWRK